MKKKIDLWGIFRIMKEVSQEIAFPVTKIVNKSQQKGKLSNYWKFANVTPIYNKGDRKCAADH